MISPRWSWLTEIMAWSAVTGPGRSGKRKIAEAAAVERMQKETPGDTIFESSRIGPIYADQLAKGKINQSTQTCRVWAMGNPEDVGPYFSLAIIYRQMGKKDEAKKCLEKVLQLDPAGRNAPMARMRMAELQSK